MDMAGVKTVDILLGVIVVLQCVGNAQAEITTSNGKTTNLKKSESLILKCVQPAGKHDFPHRSQVECFSFALFIPV